MQLPLTLIVLAARAAGACAEGSGDAQARALLAEVVAKYHALAHYQDAGESVLTLRAAVGEPARRHAIRFATRYRRDGGFEFSMRARHAVGARWIEDARECFWSDEAGEATLLHQAMDDAPRRDSMSFAFAVASLSGVSHGSAQEVFRLLSDGVGGFRIDQLRNQRVLGHDIVDGVPTTQVQGETGERSVVLWIGDADKLLYRTQETLRDGTTQITQRRPLVRDGDAPTSAFGACVDEPAPAGELAAR